MALSDYEKEKMEREARIEADLRRAQRAEQAGDLDYPAEGGQPGQDYAGEEQAQQPRESRYESGMNQLKREGRQRLWQKGREDIGKRFGKKGAEQAGKPAIKTGAKVAARGAGTAARIGAGAMGAGGAAAGAEGIAAGGAAAAGVGAGGAAIGGTAVGGAAAGGAVAGGAAAAGGIVAGGWVILVIIAVILAILLLVLLLVLLVVFSPIYICNAHPILGGLGSWTGEAVGMLPKDICRELVVNKEASTANQAGIGACTSESSLQELATINREPYPSANNTLLLPLMTCIGNKVPQAVVNASLNVGSYNAAGGFPVYTFDNTYKYCNYTRGDRVCGPCSHAQNSCHYGGSLSGGYGGSLAVDYSTRNPAIAQQIVNAANQCGAKQNGSIPGARCEDAGSSPVACTSSTNFTHVHINAAACDRN